MSKFELQAILDSPFYASLQDQMARVTGVSIHTVDYKGIPMMNWSSCSPFCQAIRTQSSAVCARCARCDALAGLEAARQERPYAYLCHCNLANVAIPIVFGDRQLGSIIFGQIRLVDCPEAETVHGLIRETTDIDGEFPHVAQELKDAYAKLPLMDYRHVMDIAELIHMVISYIVAQRANHYNDQVIYEWILKNGTYPQASRNAAVEGSGHLEAHQLRSRQNKLPVLPSSVLYPAVNYIHQHPREKITMQSMADLCHLSPSYFSRIFQRDVGESFNEYVNRQKVIQAKEMLKHANLSIAAIASTLGYRDSSYFIKVFKKHENITPQEYRDRQ